jgi:hypothetical protein
LQVRFLPGSPLLLLVNQYLGCVAPSVLPRDPCCVVLQFDDSDFSVLQAATNDSTQHERNTALPASFTSDTDTIDLLVTLAAVAVVVIGGLFQRRKQK